MKTPRLTLLAAALSLAYFPASAQQADGTTAAPTQELGAITVNASADASAGGLSKTFSGGQVARGARTGILGTQDTMDTPFSITSYTHQFIADQQAQSVGEVLANDSGVRLARGYGNFQELYVIRGFPVYSDDIGYNGLYGMLPRQYVASEFFERVEIVRGANAFLNGAAPGGSSIGGAVNLLPKRAGNEPLTQFTTGIQSGGQVFAATDISRRFGPDESTGLRLNAVRRKGDTEIDRENRDLTAIGLGLDWHNRNVRLSADVGYQDNRIEDGRPSVTPDAALTAVPRVPGRSTNYAQPWTYSSERDTFGTVRAEWDISDQLTAWAAGGLRYGSEANVLANPTVTNAAGDTTTSRFDNTREDQIATGELGLRYKFATGSIGHEMVASAASYRETSRNAYAMGFLVTFPGNLEHPYASPIPANNWAGGDLDDPHRTRLTKTRSYALADTLSFIDDKLRLTLGARHQTIEKSTYNYDTGVRESKPSEKSAITPVVGVVVRAAPGISVYGNYIEALVSPDNAPQTFGAANTPVANAGTTFAPYRSKQKEIGVKWDGKNVGASAAIYALDKPIYYTDATSRIYGEHGEQRNRGLELNVYGQPVKGLRLLGGATFTQAKQMDPSDPALDDKFMTGVPKRLFNLGAEWDVPGVQGLALNARVVHTSSQYMNTSNSLEIPSWTRTDIGARYLMNVGNNRLLTLRARIDNLFNRNYWASVGGEPNNSYLVQSTPRTISISASMDF